MGQDMAATGNIVALKRGTHGLLLAQPWRLSIL